MNNTEYLLSELLLIVFIIGWVVYFILCIKQINKRLDEFKGIYKRLYLLENPYKYQQGNIVQFKYPEVPEYVEMPEMVGIITNRSIIGEESFGKLYMIFVEKEKRTYSMPENYIIGLAK